MNKKETNCLDPLMFLRVLSIFVVFCYHTTLDTNIVYGSLLNYSKYNFILNLPAWGGVWILILLSGFLIGKGFFDKRYELSFKGVTKFYYKRFVKVVIPYYIFIFITGVITYANDYHGMMEVIPKLLLLNYKADIGFGGIGPIWFVSTIFQLYLIAPFVYMLFNFIINKIKKHKDIFVVGTMVVLLIFGLGIRSYQFLHDYDWVAVTYSSLLTNVDIFIIGMLLNYFCNKKFTIKINILRTIKIASVVLLISLMLITSYIHNMSIINPSLLITYKYYFPTLYIIFGSLYLYSFSIKRPVYTKPTIKNIIKNPYKIIELLSKQSYEFYLWHAVILRCLTTVISVSSYNKHYIILWGLTFIIGNVFAYLFTTLDERISKKLLRIVKIE